MSSSRHDALHLSLCLHILVSSLGRLHVVIPSLDRLHIVAFSVGRRCLFFGSADEHSTCALPCIFSTPYLLCLSISWYHLHLCMHARALSPSLPSTLPPSYPTLKPAQDHSTHPNSNHLGSQATVPVPQELQAYITHAMPTQPIIIQELSRVAYVQTTRVMPHTIHQPHTTGDHGLYLPIPSIPPTRHQARSSLCFFPQCTKPGTTPPEAARCAFGATTTTPHRIPHALRFCAYTCTAALLFRFKLSA